MAKFLSLPANKRRMLIAHATEGTAGTLADLQMLLSEIADSSLRDALVAAINQLVAATVVATYR